MNHNWCTSCDLPFCICLITATKRCGQEVQRTFITAESTFECFCACLWNTCSSRMVPCISNVQDNQSSRKKKILYTCFSLFYLCLNSLSKTNVQVRICNIIYYKELSASLARELNDKAGFTQENLLLLYILFWKTVVLLISIKASHSKAKNGEGFADQNCRTEGKARMMYTAEMTSQGIDLGWNWWQMHGMTILTWNRFHCSLFLHHAQLTALLPACYLVKITRCWSQWCLFLVLGARAVVYKKMGIVNSSR